MIRKAALGIFAVLVVIAPLLFGAVDRQVQIGLIILLGIGLILVPPVVPPLSPWTKRLLVAWIVIMLLKEFGPVFLFGHVKWRSDLGQYFGVVFPWTHNPEPGRAVDCLLAILIGGVWFQWVRTLAAHGDSRPFIYWSLFGSAAVLAIVSLAVQPSTAAPHAIYGIRMTPGWTGFGPFPNRNHTADFLAMGALLGCGCLTTAARRLKQGQIVASFIFLILIIIALLLSKSRGGLIACVAGLAVYAAFSISKLRNRGAIVSVVCGAALFGILLLGFGGKVLSRFQSANEGDIPTNVRWQVWSDTLTMWKNAPLFGHGLDTFPQIFPIYQTLKLENQNVNHPESSWLLWLAELGAIPLLIALALAVPFIVKHLRSIFEKKHGFFLPAAGFSALAVLLIHSLWDVPSHRWATAAYALAILAYCAPLALEEETPVLRIGFKPAVLTFATAIFWVIPYFSTFPVWSPTSLEKFVALMSQDESLVTIPELHHYLQWFPLNANLHQCLGSHYLSDNRDTQAAWSEFHVADRLEPSVWPLPAAQAAAALRYSPGMALHYWSLAIERAGHRAEEVFFMATRNTARVRLAGSFWSNYVLETNPRLLLTYSLGLPDSDARYYYQTWWKERATSKDLADFEVIDFYRQLPRYGSMADLYQWMSMHPELAERDYKAWADNLHHWRDDATAWQILSKWVKEPEYPPVHSADNLDSMEATWHADPANVVNAQVLAQTYAAANQSDKCRDVILTVAAQPKAPAWFVQKAAYQQASDGRYEAAVTNMLRTL